MPGRAGAPVLECETAITVLDCDTAMLVFCESAPAGTTTFAPLGPLTVPPAEPMPLGG